MRIGGVDCGFFPQGGMMMPMATLLWMFLAAFILAFMSLSLHLGFALRDRRSASPGAVLRLSGTALFAALFNCGFFVFWLFGKNASGAWNAVRLSLQVAAVGLAIATSAASGITAWRRTGKGRFKPASWAYAFIYALLALSFSLTAKNAFISMSIVNAYLAAASVFALVRILRPAGNEGYQSQEVISLSEPLPDLSEKAVESSGLSGREREIVSLLNRGLSNKEIAYSLKITSITVKNHVYNIYQKTGIRSRVELLNLFRQDLENRIGSDE
jgi:DNA-binding NarL/FixJ family response regulator